MTDPTPTARTYYMRADGQVVHCNEMTCAGITLHAAITSGRKNQRNFLGLNGEGYKKLTDEEVADIRADFQQEFGIAAVCEHEVWAALKAKES